MRHLFAPMHFGSFSGVRSTHPDPRQGKVNMRQAISNLSTCTVVLLTLMCCLFLVRPAFSHHSFTAEFTAEKTTTLTGTVTQVWFRNPHVRYLFVVVNSEGDEEVWDARGSPVVWLARKGWKKSSIEVGDTVTMYGFLGRDGRKLLSIMTVTLDDGTVLVDRVPE